MGFYHAEDVIPTVESCASRLPKKRDFQPSAVYNPFVEINQPAPDFELPDLDGRLHRLSDYRGRIVVVNFWSCDCPHSERTDRSLMATFIQWGDGVTLLTIAANRNESAEAVTQAARARRLPTLLVDAAQIVADLYEAQTTPHAFVIDHGGLLRYHGAVDDVAFRQKLPTRFHVEAAVEALLEGRIPEVQETPAFGCVIVRDI